ncbi:MAG: PAS domain-containing protein [Candidatus Thorarchaeota archaeon]
MQHTPHKSLSDTPIKERSSWCRQALDLLSDPLHVVDKDLRILAMNQTCHEWLETFGLEDSLIGRSIPEVFPFLPAKVCDEYQYVFETGEILVTSERTLIEPREVYTETRKLPVVQDGEVIRVVTIIHDITDQRLFQSILEDYGEQFYQYRVDTDQRFRAIFDASPVSICIIDSEGTLTDANPACARLFGIRNTNTLIGFDIFEAPYVSDWVKEKVRTGEQVDFEWVLDMDQFNASVKCGSSRTGNLHIGVIVSPLLDNKSVKGWIVQMQDITRWRYAQMELQQAQEVAMGYMDMMTHGIANHLQSMLLCTGLLAEVARKEGKGNILNILDSSIAECIDIIMQVRKLSEDGE